MSSASGLIANDGSSYVKESFSAFGARRSACTWNGPPTSGQPALMDSATRRGDTGHMMLDSMGLNDMSGRIQDAVTGRFPGSDPTAPSPASTQNWNHYSYVNNNPLTFTDPTGFTQDEFRGDADPGWTEGFDMAEADIQGSRETAIKRSATNSPDSCASKAGRSIVRAAPGESRWSRNAVGLGG